MNYYYIHDLKNYILHKKIVKNLRQLFKGQTEDAVYEIFPDSENIPTGVYCSPIDQIWFIGNVLASLADIFNDHTLKDGDQFVYDPSILALDWALDMLSLEKNIKITKIDYRVYEEKFKEYLS